MCAGNLAAAAVASATNIVLHCACIEIVLAVRGNVYIYKTITREGLLTCVKTSNNVTPFFFCPTKKGEENRCTYPRIRKEEVPRYLPVHAREPLLILHDVPISTPCIRVVPEPE